MFKKILCSLLCSLCLITCVAAASRFHDANGNDIPTAALKGKWIIVNYWAAWCRACVEEVPELNEFYRTNHDSRVVLFGVNYDQPSAGNLKEMVHLLGIHFPVMVEDPIEKKDDIEVLPTTLIVNPAGEVVQKIEGQSRASTLRAMIRALQKK